MTPDQRKAIEILNELRGFKMALDEDDYFFLLDFIVKNKEVTYVPYTPDNPYEPYKVWYGETISTSTTHKEE